MFTGIVDGIARIVSIKKKKNFHSYTIKLSSFLSEGLKIGASVSNNGCCLTVKDIDKLYCTFDVIKETLNNTNLGLLNIGDLINIERSAKYGDEIGGHMVSGHILNTAEVLHISQVGENYTLWLKIHNKNFIKYFFYKGFICIDGISLTINKIFENEFCVHLIPETLSRTTIKNKTKGSLINIEIDLQTQIIVDTTERFIKNQKYSFSQI